MRCLDCGRKLMPRRDGFRQKSGRLLEMLRKGPVTTRGVAAALNTDDNSAKRWLLRLGALPQWEPTHKRGRPPVVWTLPAARPRGAP